MGNYKPLEEFTTIAELHREYCVLKSKVEGCLLLYPVQCNYAIHSRLLLLRHCWDKENIPKYLYYRHIQHKFVLVGNIGIQIGIIISSILLYQTP